MKNFGDDGPEKVEVAFTDGRGRYTFIVAYANGHTKVTEYRCSTRRQFDCEER
ncbi:MAG TPA: hypothetical protein VEG38_01280 [Acidimicrobiia bacterium]|nr:hypothetical protein [Acidimicrobiia bacterium]